MTDWLRNIEKYIAKTEDAGLNLLSSDFKRMARVLRELTLIIYFANRNETKRVHDLIGCLSDDAKELFEIG